MPLVKLGKEIECPKCRSINIEQVPFMYQSLKSKGAGKKLFSDSPFLSNIDQLPPYQKEKLLRRLMPPEEPRKTLPAKPIAFMAFFISWLGTCAILLGRLGYQTYSLASVIICVVLAIPFYIILRFVIGDFKKNIGKYHKLRGIWEKLLFCQDCYHVFTAKDLK